MWLAAAPVKVEEGAATVGEATGEEVVAATVVDGAADELLEETREVVGAGIMEVQLPAAE